MIKRTKISDYKVTRYSKPMTAMKLKNNDKMISISDSKDNNIFIGTHNGYGLWYDINEVPVIGPKASGVKAISLKNDYVVSGLIFGDNIEYITVITDKGTGKRVKVSEFEKTSRARRGLLLVREIKTNPHFIMNVFASDHRLLLGVRKKDEIKIIKVTELPIADRYASGSSLIKEKFDDIFEIKNIIDNKEETKLEETKPEDIQIEDNKEDLLKSIDERMMTIDDFLNDINN